MPLAMNREVFITCAVTGSGGSQDRSPHVPRSPAQIADSAIAAAKAGAAIVHCHVRDPETGAPSRDPGMFREVTDRIRASDTDVVLNLTAGMGGDLITGSPETPLPLGPGTDMAGATERVQVRPAVALKSGESMTLVALNGDAMQGLASVLVKLPTDRGDLAVRER